MLITTPRTIQFVINVQVPAIYTISENNPILFDMNFKYYYRRF